MQNELAESHTEYTRTLQSLVLCVQFKGRQYSILFSLYYLGLKKSQRVNKDGILLYLKNYKFG
jgi:hypothetical protein